MLFSPKQLILISFLFISFDTYAITIRKVKCGFKAKVGKVFATSQKVSIQIIEKKEPELITEYKEKKVKKEECDYLKMEKHTRIFDSKRMFKKGQIIEGYTRRGRAAGGISYVKWFFLKLKTTDGKETPINLEPVSASSKFSDKP